MILPKVEMIGIYNSQKVSIENKLTKKRTTTMFEIELPIENGGISYINGERRRITTDMLICAKPGSIRNTKFPFKCYYIHLSLEKGALYDALINADDFITIENIEIYKEIFTKLIKYFSAKTNRADIKVQSLILDLIYRISADKNIINFKKNNGSNEYAVNKATEYIKNHLTEDLCLEKIAEYVSLSPAYFHKSFKTAIGTTVHQYIEERRIKKAIDLMLTSNKTLTEIAYECGFGSQSYFSYAFKRRMKTTPRKYIIELNNLYEKNE
ncbi:MAG: helix-turn-helix domain-containing protein [Ruminococcaceae bacterium]|nr:helix-turn-helix domain-containing protein [Oscillospiraceae bacterium]